MSKPRGAAPKIEKSCPLSSAHNRLRDAHDLWHRAVAAYGDPDEFVLLNQLLVTLRQVTFMVQTQKAKIPDFDQWYEGWQDRMRADPLMTWLKDARTHVEKVGDLELASTARVAIVASWLASPFKEFEVAPLTSPQELAATFPAEDLPEEVRKEGLLRIERRWVSQDLPEHELTDVCAHGYGVLATLLAEAHEMLGVRMRTFGGETHEGRHVRTDHLGGRLPCMVITDEDRVAHLDLATGELLNLHEATVGFDPEVDAEWYEERMKAMTVGPGAMTARPDEDAFDLGQRWMSVARRTLAHDGYHLPHAFLLTKDNVPITVIALQFEGQAEKYMAFQRLAREVDRLGADIVILINEVWMAPAPEGGLSPTMQRASQRADRSEALAVIVALSDGRSRSWYSSFTRDKNNKPVLGEVIVVEQDEQWSPSLAPLQAVWARWPKMGWLAGASDLPVS